MLPADFMTIPLFEWQNDRDSNFSMSSWGRWVMTQQVSSKVPFVLDNVSKCLCPGCPVQGKSPCVAGLKTGLNEALKKDPLKHEEIPGQYCGAGKATCTDLDPGQTCMCTGCEVFKQYELMKGQPIGYYCRDGASR